MKMVVWRHEVLLLVLVPAVGFLFIPAHGQRRLGDRVLAAQDIPLTNFSCTDRTPGYYADVETGCQVYHMCTDGGQQFSYRCPNTTLFQQRMLICAHWYQVNCSRSEQDYNANLLIGQRDKPFVDESEHINIYFNNDKDFHPLKNPEDLQRLGPNGNGGGRVQNPPPFTQSILPSTGDTKRRINTTNKVFQTTHPIDVNFRPTMTTNNPFVFNAFQTRPLFSTTNTLGPFNTHFSTTPFPQTNNYEQDYDTTTTDYFDENINNSYNTFINRFIPGIINETDSNVRQTTSPGFTTNSFNDITTRNLLVQSTTPPTLTTFSYATETTQYSTDNTQVNDDNNQKQQSFYNNFISRFIPFINETNSDPNDGFTHLEHRFLKRFNPEEAVPNANTPVDESSSNQQITQHFLSPSTFMNNQNLEHFDSLAPPFKEPSLNLELPQETEDADHMESNILELQFQDPRQVFFIPDNDHQNIPVENATPITVNIPRQVTHEQLHPMLFVNSAPDVCSRCHPSFIVNKSTCSPCVVIR